MRLMNAITLLFQHNPDCTGCDTCDTALAVVEANHDDPAVHMALRNGLGQAPAKRRPTTLRLVTAAPAPARPTPPPPPVEKKTATEWVDHFEKLYPGCSVPPPPNYTGFVKAHFAKEKRK